MIRSENGALMFNLQKLPLILLTQIASNLNLIDQKSFAKSCRAARKAVKLYWDTRTELHIGILMKQTFSFMNRDEQCSLHAIRNEIGQVLRLMPDFALRNVRFQPICSLHVQDLRDIEYRTKKSAKQIFGAVKHLDLRGCMMEYDELKYFSHACSKLSSIAITYAAAFLPNEIFLKHENLKQNKMRSVRPFQKIRNFLQISLPNFAEMEKKGQLPEEHIDLLAKLLKLFPYLQTLQVD